MFVPNVSVCDAPAKTYRIVRACAARERSVPSWCTKALVGEGAEQVSPLEGPCVLATVADAWDGAPPPTVSTVLRGQTSATIAVGPERGWTVEEYNLFRDAGWQPATLFKAPRVLDSATATLSLLAVAGATLE